MVEARVLLMFVLLVFACAEETVWIRCVCLVLIAALWATGAARVRANAFRMHLVATSRINESLVLQCRLAGQAAQLFMIDTGYAGPPVLSASYLATEGAASPIVHESVQARYTRAVRRMASVTVDDQNAAVDRFLRRRRCQAYTSGCTMRLMGIGATREQQADMLLCDMLEMQTHAGPYAAPHRATKAMADVFVTNPLPSSVHILTCDFLMHAAPALLRVADGTLQLNMTAEAYLRARARCTMHAADFSGGAFVVPFQVGSETYRCTVDTGAPGPISLGLQAGARLAECSTSAQPRAVHQSGVNGERVCSQIVRSTVRFCGQEHEGVPIFVNDTNVDQVDGYVGMGFLRAFDILITPDAIGFCPNGNRTRSADEYDAIATRLSCEGVRLSCRRE